MLNRYLSPFSRTFSRWTWVSQFYRSYRWWKWWWQLELQVVQSFTQIVTTNSAQLDKFFCE